jgi:hypothetical protein
VTAAEGLHYKYTSRVRAELLRADLLQQLVDGANPQATVEFVGLGGVAVAPERLDAGCDPAVLKVVCERVFGLG